MSKAKKRNSEDRAAPFEVNGSRRKFLAYSGATLAISSLVLAGCGDDDDPIIDPIDKPDAPTNLTADNSTSGQVMLNWEDNATGEDGYSIERSLTTTNSDFAEIAEVGEDVTTYTDSDVETGTTYYYRVRTKEGTDYSDYSNVVSSEGMMTVNLGAGDVGVLNYAFALEQLEAAFYAAVVADANFATTFNAEEQQIFKDIEAHEIIHREFFRAALTGAAPNDIIPNLSVDFSSIDFASKENILTVAKTFEDLGVAAYNGAGKIIETPAYLLLAGKIVSVEARHAAAIRDLINPMSADFAGDDVVDENGLDRAMDPADVLAAAQPFILETIDGSNLPTA